MKKNIILLFFLTFSLFIFSQDINNDSTSDIAQIKQEIKALRNDVDELKKKTEWFNFKLEGSVKITWGAAVLQIKGGDNWNAHPITSGFDFDNSIKFKMDLGKTIATSSTKGGKGTEILIDLMLKSNGISEMQPEGSWYSVGATDDQGNAVDIYFPRYESGSSNVVFGNIEIALKQALVKNILGTGFFINYKDVQEVHQYYGIEGMTEVVKLNHDFFNNGFAYNSAGETASLYYSFDADDYEPESETAEAVKMWSNSSLHTDPNNSDYNQEPHGFSIGYDKDLSEGFNLFVELGASSKDAFDPKYYLDENFDYGFFLKMEPKFFSDKVIFHPKLAGSFAFQSETTEDMRWEWSSVGTGLSVPVSFMLPTGPEDYLKLEANWNMNAFIVTQDFAMLLSAFPEILILNKMLKVKIPFVYSFKNSKEGGFLRTGHPDVKWIDQLYEDHVLNLGLEVTFNTRNLLGDIFEYEVKNSIYFTFFRQWFNPYAYDYSRVNTMPEDEYYFYELLENTFSLKDLGPERISMFLNFGLGYCKNARIIYESTNLKYEYDRENDVWIDTEDGELMEWDKWGGTVLSVEAGLTIDIMQNLSVGLSGESPKILTFRYNDTPQPLGNQNTYGIYKLWSEIKF